MSLAKDLIQFFRERASSDGVDFRSFAENTEVRQAVETLLHHWRQLPSLIPETLPDGRPKIEPFVFEEFHFEPLTPAPAEPSSPESPAPMPLKPGSIPPGTMPASPPAPIKPVFSLSQTGRAGQPFAIRLDCAQADVRITEVSGVDGVLFDSTTQTLTGCMAVAGDYPLTVRYQQGPQTAESTLSLIINADPRALWKNLPSNTADPDWKPDLASEHRPSAQGRQLLAVSQRGRSHAHVGAFRDDDFLLGNQGAWHWLAVADGAGSASLSRRGSQLIMQRVQAVLTEKLSDALLATVSDWQANPEEARPLQTALYGVLGAAAFEAAKAVEQEAASRGVAPREFASTLLLALHTRTPAGEFIAGFQVGDGAMAALGATDARLLGAADSGEFAGQTRFLDRATVSDGAEIMRRIHFCTLPELKALILMTDGVSDPKFETDHNLAQAPRWQAFWQEIAPALTASDPAAALSQWLDFWSPGNHDDRTLALLW